ncbi:hypothetical protein AB6A40_003977 [Gnathostoma spinigerum]|uniref:Mannose-P-dolichol utilization defect 1 protein homolog n=1 Tax=Gnathostoma spinigerum TaxID=75299 RepID=A0ABD6EBA2_9BILA
MTNIVQKKFDELIRFVFPRNCFEELVIKLNISNADCVSLVISRLLGLGITLGSLLLFVPQIIKIHIARSGEGVSLSSQLFGLLSCFATTAYSYSSNFVFSQWGDSLFVSIQMVIIIMQILYFSDLSAYAFAFFAFCWAATFAVIGGYIPFSVLYFLQALGIPIVIVSKALQIIESYRRQSTGQLSLISVSLQLGGCIARIFTSIKETGDMLVILSYIIASAMNGIIFGQVFWYWNSDVKKAKSK